MPNLTSVHVHEDNTNIVTVSAWTREGDRMQWQFDADGMVADCYVQAHARYGEDIERIERTLNWAREATGEQDFLWSLCQNIAQSLGHASLFVYGDSVEHTPTRPLSTASDLYYAILKVK